ncbi:MAG: helix-turn-helix domain-containing protein [Spirochaetales bacterium]
MIIGKRLKELRQEKNISQKEIADAIGVDISSISYWENEIYEPKASYIFKLAKFFDVTSDYLLGLED